MNDLETALAAIVRSNPQLMQVLTTVRALDLPDWRVFSGAVYQAVWNAQTGRPVGYGIKDYDLGYFDPDTSWDAEDVVIKRVAAAFDPPLRDLVEVRNQARVHLWFEARFGEPYDALPDTDTALSRFVAPAFAVGVRLEADDTISVAAPFGLEDVFSMTLRPNPVRGGARGWRRTVENARGRWPEITVIEPDGMT
ncbi:nucleotidyltransferase family protein [Brevundimonas sp.]|uniref:nucleotidyltransferase family protein n=1 Tax=Brevundimonas sp. TaxID=1871086 RepID=UPI003A93513C